MEISSQQPQPKTVFLATYCPSNNLESFYVHSLADTIKLCLLNGIRILPIFINDIQSSVIAKNEVISNIINKDFESVIFVDHNIAWDPAAILSIINSQYDAVAIPVVRKVPGNVIFDLDIGQTLEQDADGYIKVNYASTAMFKLSNKLVTMLSDSNISIINPSGNEVKNVFETSTQYGKFFNESIVLCNKIRDLGITVWVNPTTTCANIAGNIFAADFAETLLTQSQAKSAATTNEIKSLYE